MSDLPTPNWKSIIRERLAALSLEGAAESNLTEELAQHLEDCYREYRNGGDGDEEAYRKTVAELDNTHPLAAAVQRPRYAAKDETISAGDNRAGSFFED